MLSTSKDLKESIKGDGNMNDVIELLAEMCCAKEPQLRYAKFIKLSTNSLKKTAMIQK